MLRELRSRIVRSFRTLVGLLRSSAAVVLLTTCVHLAVGITLTFSSFRLLTVSTAPMIHFFGANVAGLLYVSTAAMALWGVVHPGKKGLAFALPQNGILWVAAASAAFAVHRGMYADLVLRPPTFIFVDQAMTLFVAPLHAIIIGVYHGSNRGRQ